MGLPSSPTDDASLPSADDQTVVIECSIESQTGPRNRLRITFDDIPDSTYFSRLQGAMRSAFEGSSVLNNLGITDAVAEGARERLGRNGSYFITANGYEIRMTIKRVLGAPPER